VTPTGNALLYDRPNSLSSTLLLSEQDIPQPRVLQTHRAGALTTWGSGDNWRPIFICFSRVAPRSSFIRRTASCPLRQTAPCPVRASGLQPLPSGGLHPVPSGKRTATCPVRRTETLFLLASGLHPIPSDWTGITSFFGLGPVQFCGPGPILS
jgi:hypothetical protein